MGVGRFEKKKRKYLEDRKSRSRAFDKILCAMSLNSRE